MAYYTRSRAANEYKSAGVLPFALSGDQILVLLGAEKTRTGPKGKVWKYMWRDFGGGREAADADSAATAAREFAEETLGLYGGCSVDQSSVDACAVALVQRLRDPSKALKVVHALKKGKYDMYVTQISLIEPLIFRLATQQNQATGGVPGGEKSAFAWVPLAELLRAVGTPRRRYHLTCRSSVCGGAGTPPPCGRGCRQFALHPCFANSLRLAQGGGLQELLSRSEALPLPAPPPAAPSGFAPAAAAPMAAAAAVAAAVPAQRSVEGEGAAAGEGGEEGGDVDSGGPSGSAASQGPTPEHMCYWLAVEGIAMELRGEASAAAFGAAGATAAAPAAAPPPPPPPPLLLPAVASCKAGPSLGCEPAAALGQGSRPVTATPAGSHTSSARSQQQAAAIAAAVAAAAQPGVDNAGASGRRRRSRKQRQQQRQRRRRQQQLAREQQQQMQGAAEPAHSVQQHPQQQHSALDTADSAACRQGSSSPSQLPADVAGQVQEQHQEQSQGQQGHCSSALLPGFPPSHFSSYWAAAQDGLTRLLAPHASPRKRIRLE